MQPLISIIIPVYNVEKYLNECLDSILRQDLSGCEIIAVDDESTDDSLNILKAYQDKCPDTISVFTQSNGRQSKARNRGIDEANGKYIYFIDSDDYLRAHSIQTIKALVGEHSDYDVILTDCVETQYGDRVVSFDNLRDESINLCSFFDLSFDKRNGIAGCVGPVYFIYSREFLNRNVLRYKEGLKYEDRWFFYQMLVKNGKMRIVHIDEPFYVYRINRPASTTTQLSLNNFTDRQWIWRNADNLFRQHGLKGTVYYNSLLKYALWVLCEAGENGYEGWAHSFFTIRDAHIIRKGISDKEELCRWLLACLSPRIAAKYLSNKCSVRQRKCINRAFSILRKI